MFFSFMRIEKERDKKIRKVKKIRKRNLNLKEIIRKKKVCALTMTYRKYVERVVVILRVC